MMQSVIKQINEYNKHIPAELKKLKWSALAESPFRFYRGTCYLFAADFKKLYGTDSKLKTWICGDLHFENFGSYKGENRLVYFDINDFDEAILGSPEPELARFLSSIIIASEQMKIPASKAYDVLKEVVDIYACTLIKAKALMMEQEVAKGVLKKYFSRLLSRDRQSFISKFIVQGKTNATLKIDSIHLEAINKKKKEQVLKGLKPLLKGHRHFSNLQLQDVAFRLAGTGSLGLQRYCVLCIDKNSKKYYLIDIKQSRKSCWKNVYTDKQPKHENEAERIIHSEYIMQFNSPHFLTTTTIGDASFVVKEMQPLVDKLSLDNFKNDFDALKEAAFEMAPLIAYAQLRSSGHCGASSADDLITFAKKRNWKKEIIDVSIKLADNNNKYYSAFIEKNLAIKAK